VPGKAYDLATGARCDSTHSGEVSMHRMHHKSSTKADHINTVSILKSRCLHTYFCSYVLCTRKHATGTEVASHMSIHPNANAYYKVSLLQFLLDLSIGNCLEKLQLIRYVLQNRQDFSVPMAV
jgi:hypothetical protein